MTTSADTNGKMTAWPRPQESVDAPLATAAHELERAEQVIDRLWADSLAADDTPATTLLAEIGSSLRRLARSLEGRRDAIG